MLIEVFIFMFKVCFFVHEFMGEIELINISTSELYYLFVTAGELGKSL